MKFKKEKDTENRIYHIYEAIGRDYNRIQDIRTLGMHRAAKTALAKEIAAQHPGKVLEVCCGTGELAFAIAKADGQAHVDAVDFSDEMIRLAENRKHRDGVRRVTFHKENAKTLPFDSGSYDLAVCAFGLLQTDDPLRVLSELKRVLKPGGKLYLLEASVCEDTNVKMLQGIYEKSIAPAVSELLTGKSFEEKWLLKASKKPKRPREMAEVLARMGFSHISYRAAMGGMAAVHRAIR